MLKPWEPGYVIPPKAPPSNTKQGFGSGAHGVRNYKKMDTSEELWGKFRDYCAMVDATPIWKTTEYNGRNGIVQSKVPLARPYTLAGFFEFIGITRMAWSNWRNGHRQDFVEITDCIDLVIYRQKFDGAAVGIFNPTLIGRSLGLAERSEHSFYNPDGANDDKPATMSFADIDAPMFVHPDAKTPAEMKLMFTKDQLDAGVKLPVMPDDDEILDAEVIDDAS